MMQHVHTLTFCALLTLSGSVALADDPTVDFRVGETGSRLFEQITFGQRAVLAPNADGHANIIRITPAGDGTLDSLFTHAAPIQLTQQIESTTQVGDTTRIVGRYAHEAISVPFVRTIRKADAITIEITEELDYEKLDERYLVADQQWVVPLAVHADEHQRMMAFAGANRAEMFRMNMNDVNRRQMNISDNRGFIPYWDIGGIIQLPTGYTIWKANHADTMAYPMDEGAAAPGWADYSEDDWGVSIAMAEPKASAPWSIVINARTGIATISAKPASQPAQSGTTLGKQSTTFRLAFHETSWPVFHPCELDVPLYHDMLEYMFQRGLDGLAGSIFGTRDIQKIVARERIQPSVALRTMYRGDDWRIGSIMRDIGQPFTRGQPMADREKRAETILDYIRENGVPTTRN